MRGGTVIFVTVLLIAGAIVNVAVAWLCAGLVNYGEATERVILTVALDEQGGYVSEAQRASFGFTQSVRRLMRPGSYGVGGLGYMIDFPPDGGASALRLSPGETIAEADPELQRKLIDGSARPGLIAIWPWETSAGWPIHSMACWHHNLVGVPSTTSMATAGPVVVQWGMELEKNAPPNLVHVLPLHPKWKGFFSNTLLYSVMLGVMWRGLVAMRARIRIRKGLCPACAYPRGESAVCSECGIAMQRRIDRANVRLN